MTPKDRDLAILTKLAEGPRPTAQIPADVAKRLFSANLIVPERIKNTVAGRRHDLAGYRLSGIGKAIVRLIAGKVSV